MYLTDISQMFAYCEKLQVIDLSNFYTTKVTNMYGLFQDCKELVTIYATTGFTTNQLKSSGSTYLFYGCTKIKGGDGTTYISSVYEGTGGYVSASDAKYACIDHKSGSTDPEGYFTAKPTN